MSGSRHNVVRASSTAAEDSLGQGAVVEERELTRFEQADEFMAILGSDALYYPGKCPLRLGKNAGQDAVSPRKEKYAEQVLPHASTSRAALDEERRRLSMAEEASKRLTSILDEYQEQNFLLDPYLERLVVPLVEALQGAFRNMQGTGFVDDGESVNFQALAKAPEVQRLASLIYRFTKVRGYKIIIHFFPHSVDDLYPTLTFLEACVRGDIETTWELRYVLLLWSALICMIPFDFALFDASKDGKDNKGLTAVTTEARENQVSTMTRMISVGMHFLSAPGKERDAAAVLLGRLFQRRDASGPELDGFLSWALETMIAKPALTIFQAAGIFQAVCEVLKLGRAETLKKHIPRFQQMLSVLSTEEEVAAEAAGGVDQVPPARLTNNSTINKFKAKLACRLGLQMLRPRSKHRARQSTTSTQDISDESIPSVVNIDTEEEHGDIPSEVDSMVGLLIDTLQDKDTVVRYSAAKGLSRLCGRLPRDFVEQVVDEILSLFSANVVNSLEGPEDLSNVSEFTWQGCCLALAELARRSLLSADSIAEQLKWIGKALLFEVRRGTHSVGSGVRDAACYVVWSIARAHDAGKVRPYADDLAQKLICVALFDRDISIRRAASAAFQESVGRLGVFPHGIDIIRKTDFYAVGNRRNAFLACAPEVAVHPEYRSALINHLVSNCLPHWDFAIRELGGAALASIVALNTHEMAHPLIRRLSKMCSTRDPYAVHGALTALAEIGAASTNMPDEQLQKIRKEAFKVLDVVVKPPLRAPNTGHILSAICDLVSNCISNRVCDEEQDLSRNATWLSFANMAMERNDEESHNAAAAAYRAASGIIDMSRPVEDLINRWHRSNSTQRQAMAKVLGAVDYTNTSSQLSPVLELLLANVEGGSLSLQNSVEVRQNIFRSLSSSICSLGTSWNTFTSSATFHRVLETLLSGMDDYSNDARGDVGSWIRKACIQSMRELLVLLPMTITAEAQERHLQQLMFERICAAIAKQIAERINSLRTEATQSLLRIAHRYSKNGTSLIDATLPREILQHLSTIDVDPLPEPTVLYKPYVCLLLVRPLRQEVLRGIVTGIGPQRETINRPLADALCYFLRDTHEAQERTVWLLKDLTSLALGSLRSNRYFVPSVQTLNILLEEGVVEEVFEHDVVDVVPSLQEVLDAANRSIDKVKSVPRILASLQFTIHLLAFASLQNDALKRLQAFLLHPFPTIRAAAAEALYIGAQEHLQDTYSETTEELLLSTPWSQEDVAVLRGPADQILTALRSQECD